MSSHYCVIDHRVAGVRLRELDDSRRGARFSNRKEDKLLERKLTYLSNQNKRAQISINREKEFIKTRNPKDDKDMNHLNRRYKEAMGFIMDYKTAGVLTQQYQTTDPKQGRGLNARCRSSESPKGQESSKRIAFSRIRSAPHQITHQMNQQPNNSAWLPSKLSKMSLETPTSSSYSDSESEDSDDEVFRPFSGKRTRPGSGRPMHVQTTPRCLTTVPPTTRDSDTSDSIRKPVNRMQPKSLHRMNTSVKNDFWSVLRQNRPSTVDIPKTSEARKRPSMADATKIIMQEERVIKLFMKVDKLKLDQAKLPNI